MPRSYAPPVPLPEPYRVLPTSVPFHIPGFEGAYVPGDGVLVPEPVDCGDWFDAFASRVEGALGRRFLPICRFSDGELLFLLGEQRPFPAGGLLGRLKSEAGTLLSRLRRGSGFSAFTAGRYHSGQYTREEWHRGRSTWEANVRELSKKGVLAWHLSHGPRPFQERYFPALKRWLTTNGVELTFENYAPFYFVYALLTGPRRTRLFRGKRLLVVNGSTGEKRDAIVRRLLAEGATSVEWCPISAQRSLFDRVDPSPWVARVDLVLVGAGIGKPGILLQLEPLGVPCIDAGFVFEVWADPSAAGERGYTKPDEAPAGGTER